MKQKDENRWVDDILQSMDGAEKARPSEALFGKIERRIAVPFTKGRTISLTTFSAAAASIVLLVVANLLMLTNRQHAGKSQDGATTVAQYYDITNENDGLGL